MPLANLLLGRSPFPLFGRILLQIIFYRIFSGSHIILVIFLVVSSKMFLYTHDRWSTCAPNIIKEPGSSVDIVATERAGRQRKWGSVPGRGNIFSFSSYSPDGLWGPPGLLFNRYWALFPQG
jgi:hypothetical protein